MIYENIAALCQQRGISAHKLEQDTGLGNGVVSGWKRKSPRVDTLLRVADYFGVTLDELVRGTKREKEE